MSLLGSLGLHGCAVLVFWLAAQRPAAPEQPHPAQPDPWSGTNAVEVDAIATPDPEPNIANVAATEPAAAPAAAPAEPAPAEPVPAPTAPAPSTPADVPDLPPPPKPKPKAKPKPKPSQANAETAAAPNDTGGQHAENTPAATGTFGSDGLPPGVRSLPSAFTRAIPPASGADPIWQSLPVGTQRPFVLAVQVDAEGHISGAHILEAHDGLGVLPQFEHLRQRVIALLGGGLFALKNGSAAGTELFRITITLSDRAVKEESGTAEMVERGFDPPNGRSPGRAYFTLASGRHFEARVEVLGQPARPVHP